MYNSYIITVLIAVIKIFDESSAQFAPPGAMSYPGMPGMFQMMPGQPGPMNFQMPQRKLPVVVVPHSNNRHSSSRRKRRHRKTPESESNSSESSSSSGSEDFDFRRSSSKHKTKKRRQVLTPVVSYVTKDGYVVYQKRIKKDRPNDWLNIGHKKSSKYDGENEDNGDDLTVNDLKHRLLKF